MSRNLSRIDPANLSTPPASDRSTWRTFYAHSHEWVGQQFNQLWEAQLGASDEQWIVPEDEDWRW